MNKDEYNIEPVSLEIGEDMKKYLELQDWCRKKFEEKRNMGIPKKYFCKK